MLNAQKIDASNQMLMSHGMTADWTCNTIILFDGIIVTTCVQLILSCVVFALLSLLFEFLMSLKANILYSYEEERLKYAILEEDVPQARRIPITILHVSLCMLGYLIMYGLMTYNMWIILTIAIANALGYFIFAVGLLGKPRPVSNMGCCHMS